MKDAVGTSMRATRGRVSRASELELLMPVVLVHINCHIICFLFLQNARCLNAAFCWLFFNLFIVDFPKLCYFVFDVVAISFIYFVIFLTFC